LSSTSNSVVIRARDLGKVYKLYATPRHRLLDVMGLLRRDSGGVREHAALRDVSFEVRRGEKVGIIGRNGAGKSTLLRLVAQATTPSSGTLEVRGETQALLQIGTGFHPDLTGRENVLAYLGHLGVAGAAADARVGEVTTFAELEEYIDQPVKTYSSGMAMRLMFSAATVIAPSLLVIDEVLGVGDAYFAKKSFDRIRELCAGEGTTLLLVTHDIYNAARLCDRMLWMDHGSVVVDDRPDVVVTAYEDSIRRQEERRLRLKAMTATGTTTTTAVSKLLVEIRTVDARPLPSPLFIGRLGLALDGTLIDVAPVTSGADSVGATGSLVPEGSAWGDRVEQAGRPAREFRNFGSVFHKVAALFDVAGVTDLAALSVVLDAWSASACAIEVVLFADSSERSLGRFDISARRWTTVDARASERPSGSSIAAVRTTAVGSGGIVLTGLQTCDASGTPAFIYDHGAPFKLRVGYRVHDPAVRAPQMIVVFHRNGVEDVCRLFCGSLDLSGASEGAVTVDLPRLPLGEGQYTVSVAVTEPGYYDRQQTIFFSINPGMYDCWIRALEFRVVGGGAVGAGTAVVLEASWDVRGVGVASR
jgi:lipopolysaccharide transport system ATP-binding protein